MFFQLWDNQETCPECGEYGAVLSEGLFNLAGEMAQALRAPDMTYTMLKAISALAQEIVEEKIEPEQAISRFRAIYPRIGEIIEKANKIGLSAAVYISLAAAIGSAIYAKQSADVAREQLELARTESSQKAADVVSSHQALEGLLSRLADLRVVEKGRENPEPPKEPHRPHPKPPPKDEAPPKPRAR